MSLCGFGCTFATQLILPLTEISIFTGMKHGVSKRLIYCSKCTKTHLQASVNQKIFLGSLSLAMRGGELKGRDGTGRRGGDGEEEREGRGRGGAEGRAPPIFFPSRRLCRFITCMHVVNMSTHFAVHVW
jgi:hypothetical protein